MSLNEHQFGETRTALDIVKAHAMGPAQGQARNVKGRILDFGIADAVAAKSAPYFSWNQSHREGVKAGR